MTDCAHVEIDVEASVGGVRPRARARCVECGNTGDAQDLWSAVGKVAGLTAHDAEGQYDRQPHPKGMTSVFTIATSWQGASEIWRCVRRQT